jgi:hypothetical protein
MASEEDKRKLATAGIDFRKLTDGNHDSLLNFSFSNEVILILFRLADEKPATFRLWLYHLAGARDVGPDLLDRGSLRQRVNKVKQDLRRLQKKRKTVERDAMLQAKFILPSLTVTRLPAASLVFAATSAVFLLSSSKCY